MLPQISICITTCQRPKLFKEALNSCLNQTLRPVEIVIGDDSHDNKTEEVVAEISQQIKVPINYQKNNPPMGQAGNVNLVYDMAKGEKLVLLHDDDLLLPNALEDLSNCWNIHPNLTAAYGKQYIISEAGEIDHLASDHLNKEYFRTDDRAGLQKSSAEAGLTQQFPNDGFMILSSAAKATKWRAFKQVGNGCEYDFGLRLGLEYSNFFFLNKYTAKYRITSHSISTSSSRDPAMQTFRILQKADIPQELFPVKDLLLTKKAPVAIMELITLGKRREALDIYFSKYHPWKTRLSLGGIRRLMYLIAPK